MIHPPHSHQRAAAKERRVGRIFQVVVDGMPRRYRTVPVLNFLHRQELRAQSAIQRHRKKLAKKYCRKHGCKRTRKIRSLGSHCRRCDQEFAPDGYLAVDEGAYL